MFPQSSVSQINPMNIMLGYGDDDDYRIFMINPGVYMFKGDSLLLQNNLQALSKAEADKVVEAYIYVQGIQVQSRNWLSICLTFILVFPLFFTCFDWYRRCTWPAYSISDNVYKGLGKLLRAPGIKKVVVCAIDNTFNQTKSRILYDLLKESTVKQFKFQNLAQRFDFQSNECSGFDANMRPIKELKQIATKIRWDPIYNGQN